MQTLAECLDALEEGNLPHLADLLMQRFKSREMQVETGNAEEAQLLELARGGRAGVTSQEERIAIAKEQKTRLALTDIRRRSRSPYHD